MLRTDSIRFGYCDDTSMDSEQTAYRQMLLCLWFDAFFGGDDEKHSINAACDLWGGRVVMSKEELNPKQPVAPIEYTQKLSCPLLGLFGNEDRAPTPEQVDQHEAELKKYSKNYEFHRYDGAGHGFFYYDRAAYRQEQAVDGGKKVLAFCEKNLK